MPGRQAHGRSLTAGPPKSKNKPGKASKARSQKNALNAFGIAQDKFATRQKVTPRARQLDAQRETRDGGAVDGDEDEDEDMDEEEGPRRKKVKAPRGPANDDVEYGSDSEGNEWQLGGLAEDDEDSEIDSDEAFGESDNERSQGYALKGGNSAKQRDSDDDDTEDDSQDDEGETLGAEAIDLATALDQYESDSEEEEAGDANSNSDQESGSEASDESEENSEEDDDDEEDEADPEKLAALQGMVSGFSATKDADDDMDKPSRQKISLGDLGLSGLDDPHMRKSLKLLRKEEKEKRPGATKKLDVPLSRREQGRIDRKVAYEKTNETLARWDDTVKHNRRADHLVFPLPENAANYGLAMNEIRPLAPKDSTNELEATIMGIMEQSGLSLEKESKPRPQEYDEDGNPLTRREAQNLKRKQREENAREAKRQKRIKKIKSKAYHRVHRKERERAEAEAAEGMELKSDEEREAQDRRRALERVGQRHKESKWAKQGARVKRAVWDDEFRTGLSEMARRDEELRRRKEGRSGNPEDDESETSSSGSDDEDAIRRELDALEQESDEEGRSALHNLKFMRTAAARKRAEELELLKGIRQTLDGEDAAGLEEQEISEVGRRSYGNSTGKKPFAAALDTSAREAPEPMDEDDDDEREVPMDEDDDDEREVEIKTNTKDTPSDGRATWTAGPRPEAPDAGTKSSAADNKGNWTVTNPGRKRKGDHSISKSTAVLDPTVAPLTVAEPQTTSLSDSDDDTTSSDSDSAPAATRSKSSKASQSRSALLARAFAGDTEVETEFRREKAELTREEDDQVVDNTMPGWGSWVGPGVSQRDRNRNKGRFVTKIEGVKAKDRKDYGLDRVIMNEKHAKKNSKYLATQLPHQFESRQQYERSLRLPVGPEWVTKQTFKETTKPRLLVKQGIITPMSRPQV